MKYNRILLKLSGEALAGASGKGLDETQLAVYSSQIIFFAAQESAAALLATSYLLTPPTAFTLPTERMKA